ncbi:radical SAM protein [Rhizobium leguminosarum bv. viciae]|uniref:radical SAM/SPASM domain-containing protein n=1 Tax=Rhizobium leguminosarum TaxID=384 RepID=UPI0014427322|nr:radical SAM protein [Rhizobium leguminosarum]NKK38975.1 radical SAM protein [Rhizobium leguminosarum bv. viciae]
MTKMTGLLIDAPVLFPSLRENVVIVPGPSAVGIYDLNAGEFHRVTSAAGGVLSSCDGLTSIVDRPSDEQDFIYEAVAKGIVSLHSKPTPTKRTELAEAIRPLRPPKFAWIEITSKCNQVCLHCFLGEDLNRSPHVAAEKLKARADELAALGVEQVVISGGEPTLHPDFEEILDYFSKKSFSLTVLTNGSYKKIVRYIELFKRYKVTAKIPLLGWGDSHDRMTGTPGSFHRAIAAIKEFCLNGVHTQLGSTITALNETDVLPMREFASELGLHIEFSPIFLVGYARDNVRQLVPESMERIISVCQSCNNSAANKSTANPKSRNQSDDYAAVDLHGYLTAHHECGQKILAVLADGFVTPCLLLREKQHRIGSLHVNSLTEIVEGKADRSAFDQTMSLQQIPGCSECEARFVCKAGGCPASAYALTGFAARKNPLYDKCYYQAGSSLSEPR